MNKPATEKQINFIKILVTQTGVDAPDYSTLDIQAASNLIGELKSRKSAKVVAEVHAEFRNNVVEATYDFFKATPIMATYGGKSGLQKMASQLGFDPYNKFINGGAIFANYEPQF